MIRRDTPIQRAAHRYTSEGNGVEVVALDESEGAAPAITDSETVELARVAVRMEEAQQIPQDLGWAIERDTAGNRVVRLLQARPETVWANRTPSGTGSGLHGPTHPTPLGPQQTSENPSPWWPQSPSCSTT